MQFISLKFYRLRKGIVNLIVWFPVIWNDRQSDELYIYKILIKKLELKEKFFTNQADTESAPIVATEIKEMKEAIQRLYENDYLSPIDFLDHENAIIRYREWALAEEELIKQDLETVAYLFKNKTRNWWN